MRRTELIESLVGALHGVRLDHPVRVAVTGLDAAGKTMLADELARAVEEQGRPAVRASIDDFYRPGHRERAQAGDYTPGSYYDEAFDYGLLADCVLHPLGPGGDRRVRLAVFNAYLNRPGPEEWISVSDEAVVLVDGIFLLRPELRPYWDLVVWLEISTETSLARAVERDVVYAPVEVVRQRYLERNYPAHAVYVRHTGGPSAADVVIDNTNPHDPSLVRSSLRLTAASGESTGGSGRRRRGRTSP